MRQSSLALALVCALTCLPVMGQQQPLKPREAELVNQPNDPIEPHPLNDYVPCSFVVKDRDKFHAVFNKTGNTAIAAIRAAIDAAQLTAKQNQFLQSQADALSHMYGVTLNNNSERFKQQVASATTAGLDSNAPPSDKLNTVFAKIEEITNYVRSIHAPNDIGCSESVLTYDETSDIFGKRMANTYIAVQVTIRNLSPDNEFLVHDIQVAVQTDLFFNTRDRRLAQGVAEIGQAMSPRNQAMRYLEGSASALGVAAVPLGNVPFSDAAHGFTSFIPIMKGIFPDFSIAQFSRLQDLGFTSGSLTYVIPKSGSHAMVAFIPEKVFRTALEESQSSGTKSDKQSDKKQAKAPKYKNFKDYTTDDLRAFQNSLEILVAGAHVKEVSAVTPDATALACDPATGTSASDTVTCHLTGKNLQSVKSVKLVFKSDSTEGSATSTKYDVNKTDTTKADVVFNAQDFSTLKKGQAYSVVLIAQDDSLINTTATFTPAQSPDATSLNCDSPAGATVTCHLVGKSLKTVTQLKLEPASGSATSSSKFDPDASDDTKGTVTFSATDFAKLKSDQKYRIVLVAGGKDIKTSVDFSPAAPTAQVPDANGFKLHDSGG